MGRKKSVPPTPLPKVFIGSSSEGLKVAQAVGANLEHVAQPQVWPHVFDLSRTTCETLEKEAANCRYGVFVLTPDDDVTARGTKGKAARDNVIWEHGLFSGKNGLGRTFIVMPRDVKNLKMPTDLHGITVATYDSTRIADNPESAVSTACFKITGAIEADAKADASLVAISPPPPLIAPAPAGPSDLRTLAMEHIADLLSLIGGGTAGLTMVQSDATKVKRWADNVLYQARTLFLARQDDVYVTWLRPDASSPPELTSFAAEGAAHLDTHHTFAADEGLAGKAWSHGKAVSHSPGRPHPWWVIRKGCENNSFMCAPVGAFAGAGGLLGVGSDKGFEATEDDLAVLQMFASLLCFVVALLPVGASRPGTVLLKPGRSAGSRHRPGA